MGSNGFLVAILSVHAPHGRAVCAGREESAGESRVLERYEVADYVVGF